MITSSSTTAWREPPTPRQALHAAGVDATADSLIDLSRSHSVHLAALPGGGYVVKRLRREVWEQGRGLAAEMYAYRLGSWRRGLGAVQPRARLIDERRQVLVLECVPGDPFALPNVAVARSLGRTVAGWHAATTGIPLPQSAAAGVLHMPRTPPAEWGFAAPAAREFGEMMVRDETLAALLTSGAEAWRPRCLVHADLKCDNCLIGDPAGDDGGTPRIWVIDWELSGLGDPAWDLASVIAEYVLIRTAARSAAPPGESICSPVVTALTESYAAAAGLVDSGFWRRTTLFCVARLLHLGLESASFHGLTGPARPAVDAARRLGSDLDTVAGQLEPSP